MTTKDKAPVSVVMPEVKLTVADLAYMTGLMPGATRCFGTSNITDKLVFLGLIEKAEIKPCSKAVAAYESEVKKWRDKVRRAVKAERWGDIVEIPYNVREQRRPKPTTDFVLTASGRELMTKGRAKSITSAKAACL